jgi:hypothetical protein
VIFGHVVDSYGFPGCSPRNPLVMYDALGAAGEAKLITRSRQHPKSFRPHPK